MVIIILRFATPWNASSSLNMNTRPTVTRMKLGGPFCLIERDRNKRAKKRT